MPTDTFTSGSGNWTVPSGVTSVQIEVRGPGGGGGKANSLHGGGGGGGGGYSIKNSLSVTPGSDVSYVVGAPGNGGVSGGSDSTAGGQSSANAGAIVANGGAAGVNGTTGTAAGGTASGGDTNTTGTDGATAVGFVGGNGGAGANGGAGGSGGAINIDGGAGTDPGGGGGGGGRFRSGGNGASGSVSFTYEISVAGGGTILRPIAGLEGDAGSNTWENIDDVVNQPDAGDGTYASYSGTSSGVTVEKFKVAQPSPSRKITAARLWVLAHEVGGDGMSIQSIRIKVSGTWHDLGAVNNTLTSSPQWFSYDVTGLDASSDSGDIGFELGIGSTGVPGMTGKVDVAYLEVTYKEQSDGFFALGM